MFGKGCEVYLVTIIIKEVGASAELKDISIVNEFSDVFAVVSGVLSDRLDSFTIEFEFGIIFIFKVSYRMVSAEMAELKK